MPAPAMVDRLKQSCNAEDAHHSFEVVGEHMKAHLSAYPRQCFGQEVGGSHPNLRAPNGCSTVWRRIFIFPGSCSNRTCIASTLASCSQGFKHSGSNVTCDRASPSMNRFMIVPATISTIRRLDNRRRFHTAWFDLCPSHHCRLLVKSDAISGQCQCNRLFRLVQLRPRQCLIPVRLLTKVFGVEVDKGPHFGG
jgi:hypothetical protein